MRARVATRSIGRMKGVMNMAPMGGIMCSLMVTAILCDIVDSRYFRAGVFCFISGWFSFFGIMPTSGPYFAIIALPSSRSEGVV